MSEKVSKINYDKIIGYVNNVLLIFLSFLMIYPIYYILCAAFSVEAEFITATNNGKFIIAPVGFTFEHIRNHLGNAQIWLAYQNTLIYTVLGVLISMFLSITCAFVLSRRGGKLIKIITVIIVLTMWLKPGMVAIYENIKNLGLKSVGGKEAANIWGILLPFAFSAYNVILLRTYFAAIPKDIDESAQIDGASHFRTLFSIYIPSSVPAITTVGLFYAIDRWNGYFWAEQLLDQKTFPLQVLIKSALITNESDGLFKGNASAFALILIAIVPVIVIFPFIQKYFKKGVMVGSVK